MRLRPRITVRYRPSRARSFCCRPLVARSSTTGSSAGCQVPAARTSCARCVRTGAPGSAVFRNTGRHDTGRPLSPEPDLSNAAADAGRLDAGLRCGGRSQRRARSLSRDDPERVTRGAPAGGDLRMAEFATVQLRYAEAAAAVEAAELILLTDMREATGKLRAGEDITVADRIRARRNDAARRAGGRGPERLDRRRRPASEQSGPARLARRQRRRSSCQPQLGCGRHDVRPARLRPGTARAVLAIRRLTEWLLTNFDDHAASGNPRPVNASAPHLF